MAVIAGSSVHMLDYHELAAFFSMLELVSQPEHLLDSGLSSIRSCPLAVVVECIEGQHGYMIVEVDSVEAPNFESPMNLLNLVIS